MQKLRKMQKMRDLQDYRFCCSLIDKMDVDKADDTYELGTGLRKQSGSFTL